MTVKNIKKGAWYKNPMNSSMDYGRVGSVVVCDSGNAYPIKRYWNDIVFDRIVKDGVETNTRCTQANSEYDEKMVETDHQVIKKEIEDFNNDLHLQFNELMTKGDELFSSNKWEEAKDKYYEAIELTPISSDILKKIETINDKLKPAQSARVVNRTNKSDDSPYTVVGSYSGRGTLLSSRKIFVHPEVYRLWMSRWNKNR